MLLQAGPSVTVVNAIVRDHVNKWHDPVHLFRVGVSEECLCQCSHVSAGVIQDANCLTLKIPTGPMVEPAM